MSKRELGHVIVDFDRSKWDATRTPLHQELLRSVAAIHWVRRPDRARPESGRTPQQQSASAFIASYEGFVFLVSAGHVIQALRQQWESHLVLRLTLFDWHAAKSGQPGIPLSLEDRPLFLIDDEDTGLDVGCILLRPLDVQNLKNGNCEPIPVAPDPLTGNAHDFLVALGMPTFARNNSLTREHDSHRATFEYGVPLIPYMLEAEYEESDQLRLSIPGPLSGPDGQSIACFDQSGMSGGPLLSVRVTPEHAVAKLIGVLYAQDSSSDPASRKYYACRVDHFFAAVVSKIKSHAAGGTGSDLL